MRLCVPVPCFFKGIDFCEAIKTVSSLGFDAAETYHWESLDLDITKRALDDYGVELISMCTTEFRMTDPSYRELWLDGLKRSCEAANKLGVKRLITQVGPDTGAERKAQRDSIVTALNLAAPILEAHGVTLMPEPLNALVDHKGYFLTSSSEAFSIIREVNSPFVKLVFDIYHQQVSEGNVIRNILNNLDDIAHLHSAGNPGRHELSLGENDYRFIFSAVDNAGYKGCCGLEYNPTLPPIESLSLMKKLYG